MSTERSRSATNRQIIDEAAAWFVEINEGEPDCETRERFDQWLRRSPEHAQAYLRILPVWEEGARLDAHGDPKALIAWAREGSNVVPLEMVRADTERVTGAAVKRRRPWAMAASIAVLCISLALTAWWLVEHRFVYETGIGEQRLIALSDGSRIELNSGSKLRVRFSEQERGIELLAGQALFRVAKEAGRPFVVRSDDVVVRAVGTQFDVYRKASGTVVTVVEGRVEVMPVLAVEEAPMPAGSPLPEKSAVLLSAGEQTAVRVSKRAPRAVSVNVAAATAWTEQRLEFSNTPLTEVAEEFNRYNERRLVVRDGMLQGFHVTGTFSSADPASLVAFLKEQEGVRVEESKREILVSEE